LYLLQIFWNPNLNDFFSSYVLHLLRRIFVQILFDLVLLLVKELLLKDHCHVPDILTRIDQHFNSFEVFNNFLLSNCSFQHIILLLSNWSNDKIFVYFSIPWGIRQIHTSTHINTEYHALSSLLLRLHGLLTALIPNGKLRNLYLILLSTKCT